MKILIIGGGNMGMTFAQSFLHAHIVNKDQLLILEKSQSKAEELRKLEIGTVYGEPGNYIESADLIILAVKPQDSSELYDRIKDYVSGQQLFLSIMAGVKMNSIMEGLKITKVIRSMPNLPAQVGEGMTVYSSSKEVTRIELVMVQNLLNATGKAIYTASESMIDAATAISGSGPAYVFYFMQSMIDSAVNMGFNQAEAELLTYQTFKGVVELFNKHNFNCGQWIEKVSSKGGTTEAAFSSFQKEDLHIKLEKGYQAAFTRAVELSKM